MTCSQCWTSVPAGAKICPRCGAAISGAPLSFKGLLKAYPWLAVLLTLSLLVTLWAATRRAPPPPEPIPPAVEPVAEAPAPEPAPTAWPETPPAPAPVAEPESARMPAPAPGAAAPAVGKQRPDGTWEANPVAPGGGP